MIYHDLIIVGGGASGMTAAIVAKDFGLDVAIVEGTDRVGKKILTTGNGRCNISNRCVAEPFINYHSNCDNFFSSVLSQFGVDDTLNYFLSLGLPIVPLKGGKLYPQSLQASSVVDILKMSLEDRNIPLYTGCKIKDIHKDKIFKLSTNNDEYKLFTCENLILACGGKSAPKTGSDGSAYNLAKNLGHSITKLLPGIVQLKLDYNHLKALSGVKFDGYAKLFVNDEEVKEDFGEILFTDYGISGPPILQISALASQATSTGKKTEVVVDLMPNYTKDELIDFLECHFAILSHRPILNAFIGVINKKIIPVLLKECGITDLHMPCYELSWKEKNKLIQTLKSWKFTCTGTNDFNQAQVTIGGVTASEINPDTLESKIVPNLHFAGEIMDVHGDCGGFNLQWAWSSGYVAAKSIANK
ncbi:NAD(P)/FAD-dependent oxidoreductase [Clostridium sp. NSJ-6]|uniref:NAD(P)/FAD-dependent oxidoreductase n=1 Tax=Clostridium hominis TaxID=2763036 RepID=A0ABR7DB69_9CLOT|nr:NAD(P)/FAD-dependent oxidoreductase [Clostridium hominis]MBC5628636.1 NAD(P)/FAD-dependent oxidoreductase [Clostridium hominis]MDU2674119.1 NAD(P)/FAD-dependent oxidoreductase [Clostridium sp.]